MLILLWGMGFYMVELHIASPTEVRNRIDSMPGGLIWAPAPIKANPERTVKINLDILKVVNMICLVGGFRISEVVAIDYSGYGNTSDTLRVEVTEHRSTGEEAILITVNALKKKAPEVRELGIPLDSYSEPYAKPILEAWNKAGENPCYIDRTRAYLGNSLIFSGLGYKIKSRVEYSRGEDHKLRRDEFGRKIRSRVVDAHQKSFSDHGMRHIRAEELRRVFQFTREERVSFFSWSTLMLGDAPVMDDYSRMEWIEWFPKLLKMKKHV
jgi:hypothetical protein